MNIKLEFPFELPSQNRLERLCEITANIEQTVQDFYRRDPVQAMRCKEYQPSLFSSPEGLAWVYDVVEGGLTLKHQTQIEAGLNDRIKGWKMGGADPICPQDYEDVRNLCINVNKHILTPIWAAGNLEKAYTLGEGIIAEELDFKADFGSYLTPLNAMNFLSGVNFRRDFWLDLRYDVTPQNAQYHVCRTVSLLSAPNEKALYLASELWSHTEGPLREDQARSIVQIMGENDPVKVLLKNYKKIE